MSNTDNETQPEVIQETHTQLTQHVPEQPDILDNSFNYLFDNLKKSCINSITELLEKYKYTKNE